MAIKQSGKVTVLLPNGVAGSIKNSNSADMDTYRFSSENVISGGPLRLGQSVRFINNKVVQRGSWDNFATEIEGL